MENIVKALTPRFPDDIKEIRAMLVENAITKRLALSDIEVQFLWETFSREYGGSYLTVASHTLADFVEWIKY